MARQDRPLLKFGMTSVQCEFKIVLPAARPLGKLLRGISTPSFPKSDVVTRDAVPKIRRRHQRRCDCLNTEYALPLVNLLNPPTISTAGHSSFQVKLLNSWSWAKSRVSRALSQFPKFRVQSNLATVRIKARTKASKHYHQSLVPYGFRQYPLGWFKYKLFETCFSDANLGIIHRLKTP